eukprot:TRINITY_DN26894_c0_g1_i1.p1 TRINITY_DN26894_c0_g1~~TRINITY_DN26894_c0_g1_i1.p1  ORF type:complete len:475 (+),score=59.23 TRINITY_DN26894_c0_g1_i1:31-1455(+)
MMWRLTQTASRAARQLSSTSSAPSRASYDAIIIGAGVIGASVATELSRHGWRTLNVDKLARAGQGSTGYSSGVCRMMYSIPDSVKFAWEGYTYYDDWEAHIGVQDPNGMASLRRCGALVLRSAASESFLQKVLQSYDAVGLEYELWDAAQIERRLKFDLSSYAPQRRIDDESFGEAVGPPIAGGVYFPLAGYVSDPMLAARNLQTAAEATGRAEFAFGRTVTEIIRRSGRVSGIKCADGLEVHAPVVVNVAGPHSSHVTNMAFPDPKENDMTVFTRAMRQEVSYVQAPPEVNWDEGGEGLVCTDMDAAIYFRPEVGGKILVGNVEPACDEPFHVYPRDPEAVYPGNELSGLTEQWTNQVYRAALRMPTLPLPDSSNSQGCVACYDVTQDWVPVYDKSALPGYYMAIGTSGNQFKCAGVAGRLMRELIEASESGRDLDTHPLDFELQRIPCGGTISSATFSRRRALLETSGSVLG